MENVDLVEKYRMDEEVYDKRKGTVREWIREQKAADPNWVPPTAKMGAGPAGPVQKASPPNPANFQDAQHCAVGARCEVAPGARRGLVAFVGLVSTLADGVWVGVLLDEPLGKNDGSASGLRCFEAPENHGTFARPKNVQCGDFPNELDESDDEL